MSGKRYFFALFPNAQVREQITQVLPTITQHVSGDLLQPLDWHITLSFLGNIPESKEEHLPLGIKNLTVDKFEIELENVAYWPDSRIVWLGLNETSASLAKLVSSINVDLQELGFKPDTRPHQPHLTLIRGATQPSIVEKIKPIRWQVNEFALAYSKPPASDGIRYTVRNRWLLK